MPVSVVCEPTANAVNAALREALNEAVAGGATAAMSSAGNSDADCLQSKLISSAKRVLLTKIEYEEVSNYNQSVLETLKSKYIVLKPNPNAAINGGNNNGSTNSNAENGRGISTPATCSGANGNGNGNGNGNSIINGSAGGKHANGVTNGSNHNGTAITNSPGKRGNPNELPQPKRVLFPREDVRIGWKNPARKWQVGVGMMNVGNTCYLNSTLQALFHVPAMANWLLSDSSHREDCESADAGCIICAMAKTLLASQTSQSAIRPYFVYSKLKSICKHLVMGRQEDAHEFLRYLVEAMEKSYLSRFRNFKDLDQYSKETTPLNQILGGYLRSAVRCLSCSHVSVTFQHFQDLLLDIRKADTVEDALDGYFSRERLEDMGYKCESCKKKVSATKQFSLERAPIALCIQLKRFSMIGTKLNKQITIKPRLDLTKFASRKTPGEQFTYKLVAMVTHLGASQHCGHYTAIGITESGTYYNYDDSYVRPISVQNVCNTNAYIIFYELDNTPPRQVTSTQVSGAESKENYQKQNGYGTSCQSSTASPQRMIGPQLPPAGLKSYTTNTASYTNGSKLSLNRQSSLPTSSPNSKIMIHFKNSSTPAIKSSASSSTATTTATATSSSQNGNSSNNGTTHLQNGLHAGTGNFQEPTHTKSTLAGTPNKGQTSATSIGNESSSDNEDEVSSSTPAERKAGSSTKSTLPSMPKLSDNMHENGRKTATPAPAVKSLVPYGSEESEDDEVTTAETKRSKCSSTEQNGNKNPLKRRNSSSSSSSDNANNRDDEDQRPTNGIKVKKAGTTNTNGNMPVSTTTTITTTTTASGTNNTTNAGNNAAFHNSTNAINENSTQSKAKQKTDAIDEIFNISKRNANNSSNNTNSIENTRLTPSKKQKSQSQSQSMVSSTTRTTPTSDMDDDDEDDDNAKSNSRHNINENGNGDKFQTRPPFKRAHSTPPSPPVIKTKTGYWQVTALKPASSSTSTQSEEKSSSSAPPSKNVKNPFASKSTSELFTKRVKTEKRTVHAGNGYQRESASDSALNELLKQSHRGYGASVLTWDGQQSTIEKEVKDEAREQRQRDWEDDQENDMDRGRQKKVKSHANTNGSNGSSNRTPGYNPFQEQENSRSRWNHNNKHGIGGMQRPIHGGHFRHQFQRNKFKFQRFNHKYQRPAHQRNGGGNGVNGHNNSNAATAGNGGSNNANGGYNRRDS